MDLLATDVAIQKTISEIANLEANDSSSKSKRSRSTYDYGFTSKSAGSFQNQKETIAGNAVPSSAIKLAADNFGRQFKDLLLYLDSAKSVKSLNETLKVYFPNWYL